MKSSSTFPTPKSIQETPVFAVGIDELTIGRVAGALRGTEFVLHAVAAEEACERLSAAGRPPIVLLEWGDRLEEQAAFCDALRRSVPGGRVVILAVGGPADHAALLEAAEGPVDDALARPFGGNLLLLRLRHAARTLRSAHGVSDPATVLDEAIRHGTGEVCVRSGDTVARIQVQGGNIVWTNLSSRPLTMEEILKRAGIEFDGELVDALKQEARTSGAHFMDVLVQWGMLERARARETLREIVLEQVKLVLELPDAAALFLPRSRPRQISETLSFEARGVTNKPSPTEPPAWAIPPAPESRRMSAFATSTLADLVDTVLRTEGALSAAVLQRAGGVCLYQAGAPLDADVAWSQGGALAALGKDGEEVLAATGDRLFVTRAFRSAPALMLFVSFDARAITMGLARAATALVASRPMADPPGGG